MKKKKDKKAKYNKGSEVKMTYTPIIKEMTKAESRKLGLTGERNSGYRMRTNRLDTNEAKARRNVTTSPYARDVIDGVIQKYKKPTAPNTGAKYGIKKTKGF